MRERWQRPDIDATCARLATVLERTRGLGRREFYRNLGRAGLAPSASSGGRRVPMRPKQPVTMLTLGGA